jgi:hypothetical protein
MHERWNVIQTLPKRVSKNELPWMLMDVFCIKGKTTWDVAMKHATF